QSILGVSQVLDRQKEHAHGWPNKRLPCIQHEFRSALTATAEKRKADHPRAVRRYGELCTLWSARRGRGYCFECWREILRAKHIRSRLHRRPWKCFLPSTFGQNRSHRLANRRRKFRFPISPKTPARCELHHAIAGAKARGRVGAPLLSTRAQRRAVGH